MTEPSAKSPFPNWMTDQEKEAYVHQLNNSEFALKLIIECLLTIMTDEQLNKVCEDSRWYQSYCDYTFEKNKNRIVGFNRTLEFVKTKVKLEKEKRSAERDN